jgi:hypothetical protein
MVNLSLGSIGGATHYNINRSIGVSRHCSHGQQHAQEQEYKLSHLIIVFKELIIMTC